LFGQPLLKHCLVCLLLKSDSRSSYIKING